MTSGDLGPAEFKRFNAELLEVPFEVIEAGLDSRIDAGLDELTEVYAETGIPPAERFRAILKLGLVYSAAFDYRSPAESHPIAPVPMLQALRADMDEYIEVIPARRSVLRGSVFYFPGRTWQHFLDSRLRQTMPRGDYGMQALTAGIATDRISPDYRS